MRQDSESIETTDPRRDLVGSLRRGLAVLEVLAAHPAGLTLTETAARSQLTRAGARRLLLTLVEAGYAQQDGRKFQLSPKLISVARTWVSGSSLWSFAEPFMRAVSERLGESCSAAVLSGEDVVYVARVAGPRIVSVALHVGTRLPAYCTSMGRILLSQLDQDRRNALLARAAMTARTPKTVTDPDEIDRIVTQVRSRHYAIVDQELEIGLRSIAVPLRDRSGDIVAAINVSTHSARTGVAQMERDYLPVLRDAAARIEDYFAV